MLATQFATAAQGAKADTALQTVNGVALLTNSAPFTALQLFSNGAGVARLVGVAEEALAAGRSQVLDLVGEPGIGKSTLAEHLVGLLAQRVPSMLVFVGRCRPEESVSFNALDELVEDLRLKPWSTQLPGSQAGPGGSGGARLANIEQDTEQLVLMLGTATVPIGHADALPLRLLHAHLAMGMSSRLFVTMREERGLAYDVGVHMPARRGATPFIWHLSTSADRAGEATAALLDEWQRLLQEPLSERELALAKAKFRGQDAMGRQTCGQIADRMAMVLGYGLAETHVADTMARAEQLSAQELQQAAQRQLQSPYLSLCGPGAALTAATAVWQQRQ
jgi:energy-coupling factor transporter ATP-binding protein EcfA2